MRGLEQTREGRALQAVSTLYGLDGALDDEMLGLEEIRGHVTALSRSFVNDDITTDQFYAYEIDDLRIETAGHIRHNLAAVGLRMPLRFPSEETFKTINEHPDYVPAAINLISRLYEGHETCHMDVRDIIFSQKPTRSHEHRHCLKLDTVRFAMGTDMSIAERDAYIRVYGTDYVMFRQAAIDALYANDTINGTVHSMAHVALMGLASQSRILGPRRSRDEL